jgi:hypothetical protein
MQATVPAATRVKNLTAGLAPIRARHCPRPRGTEGQKFLQRLHDRAPGHPDHGGLQELVKLGREHTLYEQNVVWPAFPAGVSREDRDEIGDKHWRAREYVGIPLLRRTSRCRRPMGAKR